MSEREDELALGERVCRTRAPKGPREAVVVVATQLGVDGTGSLRLSRG
jgi:hypothetical protein